MGLVCMQEQACKKGRDGKVCLRGSGLHLHMQHQQQNRCNGQQYRSQFGHGHQEEQLGKIQ